MRVNAQLIDATTGYHIWPERYDRELKDIFAVQDDIVQTIVGKLAVKIDAAERKRVMRKKTENLEAYDFMLRGTEYVRRRTRSENSKARQMFEKAIDIDPDFASAYVGLGQTYQVQVSFGWAEFPIQVLQQAKDHARKALSLEKSNADAYALLGLVYTFDGQYDKAINILEEGVSRNSDWVGNHIILAAAYAKSGRSEDAERESQVVLRLEPFFEIDYYGSVFRNQEDRAKIVDGLRKAGLN